MAKLPPSPSFPGIHPPSTDFGALIDGRRSHLYVYELDLTTGRSYAAATAVQIKLTGNSFFVDQAADVGNATVVFEGVQDNTQSPIVAAMSIGPGFTIRNGFANIWVANAAQPGKKLRIFYGVDVDFTPAISNNLTINAAPAPVSYQAAYKSTNNLAANGNEVVFTPASNVNGATIWVASILSANGAGGGQIGYIAKTSAPANIADGDLIVQTNYFAAVGAGYVNTGVLPTPVTIPAGKGLYALSGTLETAALRSVLYTLN